MNTPQRPIQGSGLIAAAIVGAALIVSWAIPGEPRYELAGSGSAVFRMDTDSGALIACDTQRCAQVQPPDRAKTLGPLTMRIGESTERSPQSAPAPTTTENR